MTIHTPRDSGWLDARLPVRSVWMSFLAERIPGGARWAYVFGSLCLVLLAVQILTGVAIAFFYVPAPNAALASITYFSTAVPFGRIVLGIHHWSANIFVGVVLLHVAQTFVYGAYKKPRELVWLSGVVLLLLVQGFHFTGFVLPWDQKGYWATEVGASIMKATPLVGDLLMRVMCGGEELGALTLSHFYAVHVLLLPAAAWMSHGPCGLGGSPLASLPACAAIINVAPSSVSASASISTNPIFVFMVIAFYSVVP